MIPTTTIKVQVPIELAQYVMADRTYCGKYVKKREMGNYTHRLAKMLGMYLLLKAESGESGWIKDYTKQMALLSRNFNISVRTCYTYLKELETLKLAFREGNKIRVVGWDQLHRLLDIDTKKRETINFTYEGKQKIHWWFAAIEIKSNQERQAFMIWKKVNKNSEVRNSLMSALMRRGFDATKADNLEYLSGRLFMLYIEDFKSGTEVHDILMMIRSDVNRSCEQIGKAWSMSPQLTSYWKARMTKQRIIAVSKLTIQSEWTAGTRECHYRKGCHVIYNKKEKERVWFLCDQITVLMPWKWQETLQILQAA